MRHNLVIVFEFEDGYPDYFNITLNREINSLRAGLLAYKKSLH